MLTVNKRLGIGLLFASVLAWSGTWSSDASAAAGDPDTVTCAYPVWVGFGPVHLANELGYFEEEGITVEEILDDDMPNALAAMERGDIDCYLRTVGEYQGLGRRKDTQGIIIGTIDLSTGGDGWAADQSIQSVCDLKGKNIAVEPNLPARLLMQEALQAPMRPVDRATPISPTSRRRTRSASSPAPTWPRSAPTSRCSASWSSTHQDRGAHIIVSSKDYEDLILDIVMAHTDELAAHPDKYVKFLRGIYRAIDYFYANQEEVDPDHRQLLLDHPGGVQGDAAELPLHALRGGRQRSSAPPTRRAAPTRSFATPWR